MSLVPIPSLDFPYSQNWISAILKSLENVALTYGWTVTLGLLPRLVVQLIKGPGLRDTMTSHLEAIKFRGFEHESFFKVLVGLLTWKFARILSTLMGLWHTWQLLVLLAVKRNKRWISDTFGVKRIEGVPEEVVVEEEVVEQVQEVPTITEPTIQAPTVESIEPALLQLLQNQKPKLISLVSPSLPTKLSNGTFQWNPPLDQDEWETLAEPIGDAALAANRVDVSVQRKKDQEYLFRIVATFPTPFNPTVDLACDATLRPTYDDMVEEIKVLYTCNDVLDGNSDHVDSARVEYVRTKPVFPASGRDMVILTSIQPYSLPDSSDVDGYLNVETSLPDQGSWTSKIRVPPVPKTHVRAQVTTSGRLWFPYTYTVNGEEKIGTRVIQIADLNPGGSVPGFVIKFIAGKGIPRSLGIMSKQINKMNWKSPDQGDENQVGSSRLIQLGYNGQKLSGGNPVASSSDTNGHLEDEMYQSALEDVQVVPQGKHLSLRGLIHTTSALLPLPNPVKNISKNVAHRVLDQVIGKGTDVKMDWRGVSVHPGEQVEVLEEVSEEVDQE